MKFKLGQLYLKLLEIIFVELDVLLWVIVVISTPKMNMSLQSIASAMKMKNYLFEKLNGLSWRLKL